MSAETFEAVGCESINREGLIKTHHRRLAGKSGSGEEVCQVHLEDGGNQWHLLIPGARLPRFPSTYRLLGTSNQLGKLGLAANALFVAEFDKQSPEHFVKRTVHFTTHLSIITHLTRDTHKMGNENSLVK